MSAIQNPLDILTHDDWTLITECVSMRLAKLARAIEAAPGERELRALEAKYAMLNELALKLADVRP